MSLPQSPKPGNPMYGVRECRGHWHVISGDLDLAVAGDPFRSREDAEAAAEVLNLCPTGERLDALDAKLESVSTPPAGDASPSLLPCPFCGGKANIVDAVEAGDGWKVVTCLGCDASSRCWAPLKQDVTELLSESWNHRVSPSVSEIAEELAQHRLSRATRRDDGKLIGMDACGFETEANGADGSWELYEAHVASSLVALHEKHLAERIAGRLAKGTGA